MTQNSEENSLSKTNEPKPQAAANEIEMDTKRAGAPYANFCRITATPEEMIVDFAIHMPPQPNTEQHLAVAQRIVTNWYTAKRLLYALHMTLERHEAFFGALELDPQRRVVGH